MEESHGGSVGVSVTGDDGISVRLTPVCHARRATTRATDGPLECPKSYSRCYGSLADSTPPTR